MGIEGRPPPPRAARRAAPPKTRGAIRKGFPIDQGPTSRRHTNPAARLCLLSAMTDVDGVAIFDDVVFAFEVELAGFFELHFGGVAGVTSPDYIAILHDLGADEPASN